VGPGGGGGPAAGSRRARCAQPPRGGARARGSPRWAASARAGQLLPQFRLRAPWSHSRPAVDQVDHRHRARPFCRGEATRARAAAWRRRRRRRHGRLQPARRRGSGSLSPPRGARAGGSALRRPRSRACVETKSHDTADEKINFGGEPPRRGHRAGSDAGAEAQRVADRRWSKSVQTKQLSKSQQLSKVGNGPARGARRGKAAPRHRDPEPSPERGGNREVAPVLRRASEQGEERQTQANQAERERVKQLGEESSWERNLLTFEEVRFRKQLGEREPHHLERREAEGVDVCTEVRRERLRLRLGLRRRARRLPGRHRAAPPLEARRGARARAQPRRPRKVAADARPGGGEGFRTQLTFESQTRPARHAFRGRR